METVGMTEPVSGARIKRGTKQKVVLEVSPVEKFHSATIEVDGKAFGDPMRKLSDLVWDTAKLREGERSLVLVVEFKSGRVLRTQPIRVTISR